YDLPPFKAPPKPALTRFSHFASHLKVCRATVDIPNTRSGVRVPSLSGRAGCTTTPRMEPGMMTLGAESANTATLEAAGDESVVRHSHYYDAALHRAITETGDVGGRETLERAAA